MTESEKNKTSDWFTSPVKRHGVCRYLSRSLGQIREDEQELLLQGLTPTAAVHSAAPPVGLNYFGLQPANAPLDGILARLQGLTNDRMHVTKRDHRRKEPLANIPAPSTMFGMTAHNWAPATNKHLWKLPVVPGTSAQQKEVHITALVDWR